MLSHDGNHGLIFLFCVCITGKEKHHAIRRNLLGARAPHHRHHAGADHQGGVLVSLYRRRDRRALRLRLCPRRHDRHDRQRRYHRRDRRQRGHLSLPCPARHHRGACQLSGRQRGLWPLGGKEHPHPRGRAACDVHPRHPHFHRRLLQLPDRGLGHASGH